MTLITGNELVPTRFFSAGNPTVRESSFDLTIGSIFDHTGKKVDKSFNLEPGQMVQVVSAEVFNLSATTTGHDLQDRAHKKCDLGAHGRNC